MRTPGFKTKTTLRMPGASPATRVMPFYWLADCSGSMAEEGKMSSLNTAIQEALPPFRLAAEGVGNVRVTLRTLCFGTEVAWADDGPTPLADFRWGNLAAQPHDLTSLGAALTELAREFETTTFQDNYSGPVIVLVSDGLPTDDWQAGLDRMLATEPGQNATKIAIGIGSSPEDQMLAAFMGDPQARVLRAHNSQELADFIHWVTVTLTLTVAQQKGTAYADLVGDNVGLTQKLGERYAPTVWK